MGAGEQGSPAKHSKPTSTQETPPPSYPDWSSSMQAYYGSGAAPPFFASTVASSTPHPYMWGGQHPMMPPYGTPVPYPALYPPAGVYGHPSMPMTASTAQPNAEMEAKAPNGKDRVPNKKSKGTSGNANANAIGVRTGESGKAASTNARNSNSGSNVQTSVPGNPVVSMPTTNLNMGMDLWNPSAGTGSMKMQPNHTGLSQTVVPPPMVGRENMMADQWVQDERELKRQKRKQSNRESARRSRLRKQASTLYAECEELQARVEDELTRYFGPEVVSKLDAHLQSQTDEGKS
ncbi:Basic-leucine zipper domain-containing protein [Cynara cardunculus var. scolymus]|uniref:Basic-leucine zipper domain-containing protein n=1 Tax=Cynara cardunculus var. scolymus TaxID=59895 RepID=A0A103Y0B5_CYNCS|nr:Basic-leucine zipper domain-containing protein [Cynara cardunculus var. scolymus]